MQADEASDRFGSLRVGAAARRDARRLKRLFNL